MLSTAFSSGQMTTYNVYQLKIHEFLSINVILREGYLSKGQFIVSDLAILS